MNNTKKGDSGAKVIFGNEQELVSQFLRNYSGLEILKDVRADDIEDVTDKYVPMFEEERDSDVVKKIQLTCKIVPSSTQGKRMESPMIVKERTYIPFNAGTERVSTRASSVVPGVRPNRYISPVRELHT